MGVRKYNSVNGVIRGHYDHGVPNSEVMYVRDGLGSVVATVDARGNVLNQYHYKPWGELWQKTGSAPDPRFLWAGSWGYRAYGNKWVSHYVRARHYLTPDAAWTTVDPLWPRERAYGYVEGRVLAYVDPSGRNAIGTPKPMQFRPPVSRPLGSVACTKQWNEYVFQFCNNCLSRTDPLYTMCMDQCNALATAYYAACYRKGKKPPTRGPSRFAPVPGGGEVVPTPLEFDDPQIPCLNTRDRPPVLMPGPKYRNSDDCLLLAIDNYPYGYRKCKDCCERTPYPDTCSKACFGYMIVESMERTEEWDDLGKPAPGPSNPPRSLRPAPPPIWMAPRTGPPIFMPPNRIR